MQHFRLWALTLIPWTQELCGFCGFWDVVPDEVKQKQVMRPLDCRLLFDPGHRGCKRPAMRINDWVSVGNTFISGVSLSENEVS